MKRNVAMPNRTQLWMVRVALMGFCMALLLCNFPCGRFQTLRAFIAAFAARHREGSSLYVATNGEKWGHLFGIHDLHPGVLGNPAEPKKDEIKYFRMSISHDRVWVASVGLEDPH